MEQACLSLTADGKTRGRGLHHQTHSSAACPSVQAQLQKQVLLTAMAAMQSSALSSIVHFRMPPLSALHWLHLTCS